MLPPERSTAETISRRSSSASRSASGRLPDAVAADSPAAAAAATVGRGSVFWRLAAAGAADGCRPRRPKSS
jgi:hypothetical protein